MKIFKGKGKFGKGYFKGLVTGLVLALVLGVGVSGFADSILKTVQVAENSISIKVNGNLLNAPNFVYDGRTYVQVKNIADALGKSLGWDADTKTVSINDKTGDIPSNSNTSTLPDKDIQDSTNGNTTTSTNANANVVFRNVNWGMTIDEVNSSEGNGLSHLPSTGDYYLNNIKIGTLNSNIHYLFNDDKQLYAIGVYSAEHHTTANFYIDDYNVYKNLLTDKYGKAVNDLYDTIWHNDLFKGDTKNYGTAVGAGQLEYYTYWERDNENINVDLSADNYNYDLHFLLVSKTIKQPKKMNGI